MAQRMSARPLPSRGSMKRTVSSDRKNRRIREDENVRLTIEDKKALKEIMEGKAEVARYTGAEYIKSLQAMINGSARSHLLEY